MKKLIVPSLILLFSAGMAQSRAGILGISIGNDHHNHRPPVVIVAPPVCAPVYRPPVVVVTPHVRECERYEPRRWDSHYKHYRHDDRGNHRNGHRP